MKRIVVITSIIVCVICLKNVSIHGQKTTDWSSMDNFISRLGISSEDLDVIKNLIDRRSQPMVRSVTINPENPNEDEAISIIASIVTPRNPNGGEVFEAYINYSVDDGKTMSRIVMEKETDDGNTWKGIIPGQPSGANVIFGIQAVNAFDETYVEILCETDGIFNTDNNVSDDCKNSKNTEYCDAQKPKSCLFPMSISSDKLDAYSEEMSKIPPALYIKTMKVGFNENKLFLEMNAKDKVSPGSYSPMDIFIYVAGWLNPDKTSSETGINSILRQGAIIIYAPLNTSDKCAIYYLRGGLDVQTDNQSVACSPQGNRLLLSLDRKAIEPNPSKTLEFVFLTFRMIQLSPSKVDLQDSTLFTRVVFEKRGFKTR
ncbi:MAG: hypothetical protein WCX65_10215 [bacterium]